VRLINKPGGRQRHRRATPYLGVDLAESVSPDGDPHVVEASAMTEQQVPGDNDASGTVVSSAESAATMPVEHGLADAVARLTEDDLAPTERRRALRELAVALRKRGFGDVFRPRMAMAWIADTVVEVAPRIPLRDLTTLRAHFPDLSDGQIADRLVRNAARTTAGIGAVGGGVAALEWAAPPTLLTAPALLAAETVAVVAVEIKLIGELQELYGRPVPGGGTQRALTLLQAWAGRRGVNLMVPGRGLAAVLGTAARYELRDRLLRRFGRNLTTLGPLFTGAAVAGFLNRRATLRLAGEVRKDLEREGTPPSTPG
jgi:hypothetical protein